MRRRNRACEECHRLKIKCDVGSALLGGACERCNRNNLECVPAAPRLQRDRINELETLVQELRSALRDQSSSTTPSRSPGGLVEGHSHSVLSILDARIPLSKQQDLVRLFAHHAGSAWPVVCLPMDLDRIRAKCPMLLLSVLTCSVTHEAQGTDLDVHDELVRETMHILGDEVIGKGQRSLELVQALLVATFWNKVARRGQQASCYQLIQLAADMAIDLGIAGPSLRPSAASYFSQLKDATSLGARRTWLACFVAVSTSSISTRRPHTVTWNGYHHLCLEYLEDQGEPSDILLCQIVRITQLIQEISNHLGLCQLENYVDVNDHGTFATIKTLKNKVDAWAAQIPISIASSQTLIVWHHVAMIHIHELVLHTPTNKASFAAPFIPGRIPVKDFPKPPSITPPLKQALIAIVQHCHAVISTAAEMDPALILSLPSMCFAPNILYALFVLVTAMAAATDPANTYGQCLPKECFRIEECVLKLRIVTASIKALDPMMSCFTTRFFDATGWLEEWYNDYIAILRRYETNLTIQN
ncbi:hypothetical protein EJ04DRAFT_590338 [Polyplosphaeria fusca]|uniref:Zn(2)-C6 fungal-type domain-containing protein n=1 Tax=Polyplosphaeria fusca TaxID=682080 RepID=A0A9P4QNE8_9PLEO|nr:hypothetical protein EJ04DRAFT_590338 [Polyplosphaeria fusca]